MTTQQIKTIVELEKLFNEIDLNRDEVRIKVNNKWYGIICSIFTNRELTDFETEIETNGFIEVRII